MIPRAILVAAPCIAAAAASLLGGCAGGAGPFDSASLRDAANCVTSSGACAARAVERAASGKIAHVVVIVQENRSFDDLFQGYPGADTQSFGYTSKGQKQKLRPVSLGAWWDIDHSSKGYFAACDGTGSLPGTNCKMDGFDKESLNCGGIFRPCPFANPMYGYVPQSQTRPYFALAQQYVLADRMFASNFDGSSFVSHQYLIAGQASKTVDYPLNVWGCDGGPSDTIPTLTKQRAYGSRIPACFDNPTLGDELDAAGISWRYYTSGLTPPTLGSLWSAYQAISHVRYGPDWKADVASPQTTFFQDVKAGRLPAVSWVTPTCANSDHAGCKSHHGPAWVASLVNAVGNSSYWNSTAIFILWDDYGGWYDHVPPPLADYDGLGIRVPLLIVSPYAKQGYVSHVQYEEGSVLKFIEDTFGLARLAASDARAKSPAKDCFDFAKAPRPFATIDAQPGQAYFLHEPIDTRPVDTE